jgi:hypothetical protein
MSDVRKYAPNQTVNWPRCVHGEFCVNWDLDMKIEIWIVYRLLDYEDDFKWKNSELQSCRSRRKLQFSYKV